VDVRGGGKVGIRLGGVFKLSLYAGTLVLVSCRRNVSMYVIHCLVFGLHLLEVW